MCPLTSAYCDVDKKMIHILQNEGHFFQSLFDPTHYSSFRPKTVTKYYKYTPNFSLIYVKNPSPSIQTQEMSSFMIRLS
jgi:hypothetical protein